MTARPPGMAAQEQPAAARPRPAWLSGLVVRYPYLQRHPHPAMAHFPIVFMLASSTFTVLYLLTGEASFETTAWHCLGAGVLTTPAAIATGVFTQKLHYPQPDATLVLEKRLSYLLLLMVTGAFVWRLLNPAVLRDLYGLNFLYLLLVLALTPLVTVISYFGGMLTFPLEQANGPGGAAVPGRQPETGTEARPTNISV